MHKCTIMKDPRCTPIYKQKYCSQEAEKTTPNEFHVFGGHVQCLTLIITCRIIKFRTFEHFLKFLPDAKFNPKYWTCLEFSGRYGNSISWNVTVIQKKRKNRLNYVAILLCSQDIWKKPCLNFGNRCFCESLSKRMEKLYLSKRMEKDRLNNPEL